jgi:hypothetical protein
MIYLFTVYRNEVFVYSGELSAKTEKSAFDWLDEYYGLDCSFILQFLRLWRE